MIFNFGTATDCMSAKLGLCTIGSACYALQAEKMYPNVKPYRERQNYFWNNSSPRQIVDYFKNEIFLSGGRVLNIRYSESGDFNSQADIDKLYEVSDMMYIEFNIHSHVYTARKDLKYQKNSQSLTVIGSGFMVDNEFTVRPIGEPLHKHDFDVKCKGDCKQCSLCTHSHGLKILVEPHGISKNILSNKLRKSDNF